MLNSCMTWAAAHMQTVLLCMQHPACRLLNACLVLKPGTRPLGLNMQCKSQFEPWECLKADDVSVQATFELDAFT